MLFRQIDVGGMRNFAYLVAEDKGGKGVIIDPANDTSKIDQALEETGIEVCYVINTHGHRDHISGNGLYLKEGVKLLGWQNGVEEGTTLSLGSLEMEFFFTPGHSSDGICILFNGTHLITGDTLFVGKVGGTGTEAAARAEMDSLVRLMQLPPAIQIFAGHDFGVKPSSTLGEEKKSNPFILAIEEGGFEKFLWLKDNWEEYKLEHGIK